MRLIKATGLTLLIVIFAAGCNSMGTATLHEPQPVPPTTVSAPDPDAPPAMTLDDITSMGGSAPVRFETAAYAALQRNSFTEIGADMDPVVSPDGGWIIFSSTRHSDMADIYLKKVEGHTITRLTSGAGSKIQPVFSPDAKYIAYSGDSRGNWDIYVMTADGQRPFQLTDTLSHEVHPSWSPDGSRICYSAFNHRSGNWEIWIADVANPARRKYLTNGLFPVWSPDPRVNRIAFQMARRRGTRLYSVWTVDIVDDEARMLTEIAPATANMAAISPNWSPDGRHLTYATVSITPQTVAPDLVAADKGDNQQPLAAAQPQPAAAPRLKPPVSDIWITTLDGSTRVNLTADNLADHSPFWASDGRIYFTSSRGGAENIWSMKPLDTNLMQATRINSDRRLGAAPAGRNETESVADAAASAGAGAGGGRVRTR